MPTEFTLAAPAPDFAEFERMLRGLQPPRRVHLVEMRMDEELVRWVWESVFGDPWVAEQQNPAEYWGQFVRFAARLGYDVFCYWRYPWTGLPQFLGREGEDSALLSAGRRDWVEEAAGLIGNREDFERFPWDGIGFDLTPLEALEAALPAGMKLAVSTHFFAAASQRLLGMEQTFLLSHDDPALLQAVMDRWGQLVYDYYAACLRRPSVAAIFHADDLGHKTGTLLSPQWIRQYVLPWFTRFAQLARDHGKLFCLHSCGDTYALMEDFIEQVGIEAYHSFQDVIMPVTEFHRRWGDRIGVMGGVDMDALGRMPVEQFRRYVRGILDQCMPRGRYALGAGNSLANYVRPENYLAMLQEAWAWQPG